MPPVAKHLKTSSERTGKEYRDIHEWLDNDPDKKAERHDITRIYEYSKEGLEEYIHHIHDDLKAKFEHIQHDLEKAISDTLAYFGVQ